MNKLLTSLSAALVTSGLSAQMGPPTFETLTHVGVFAKVDNATDYAYVAKGTQILRPLDVTATLTGASASTNANMTASAKLLTLVVSERGAVLIHSGDAAAGTSDSDDPRGFEPAAHSFLLRVPAPKDSKALLAVAYLGRVTGRATAAAALDVDNDAKDDFLAVADGTPDEEIFPLIASEKGFLIRITTEGLVAQSGEGGAGYQGALSLDFKPVVDRCTFTTFGTSCGPILRGSESHTPKGSVVTFEVTGAKPGVGVLMMGADRIEILIPDTRCFLYTRPILLFPHLTSTTGKALLSFLLPDDFAGTTVNQEAVFYQGQYRFHIDTSNGLVMACTKA